MLFKWLRFCPDYISADLRKRIELDLGWRVVSSASKVAILYTLLLAGTKMFSERPVFAAGMVLYTIVFVGLRVLLYRAHRDNRLPKWMRWRPAFVTLSVLVALGWSVVGVVAIHDHGLSFPSYFAIIMLIGLTGGSAVAFSIDLAVAQSIVAIFLAPIIVALVLFVDDPNAYYLMATAALGTAFFASNAKNTHEIIWTALLGREDIRLQKDQLKTVLNAIPGFVCWIGPNNYCMGINDRLAEHLGQSLHLISEDDKNGIQFKDIFASEYELIDSLETFKVSESEKEMREIRVSQGGEKRWHLVTMQKFGSAESQHILFMSLDVEEQKRIESELDKAKAKGLEAARLAALGVLASGVAHEINNPLAILKGRLEQFRHYVDLGEKTATLTLVDKFETTVDRIARIIKGLLALGCEESHIATEEKISLRLLIDDIREVYSSQFRTNLIDFRVSEISEHLQISGRYSQIGQILINLVKNSLEAVEPLDQKWIHIDVQDHGHLIVVAVTDSGLGISHDLHQQIFNPFFTTKPIGKGMGLGLSISRSIAEQHGGELTLDRNSDHTRFVLTLPLAAARLGAERAA